RTDRVNEKLLEETDFTSRDARYNVTGDELFTTDTYLQAPTLTYGGNDSILSGGKRASKLLKYKNDSSVVSAKNINLYLQRSDGVFLPDYRLPTESEWEYAALGLNSVREYNIHKGRKKYPWNGQYTRAGKRQV